MYQVPKGTEYRTKSGNRAGVASAGCEVELGSNTIIVNDNEYHQIILSNYPYMIGMFVERKLLTLVTQPDPEPQPGTGATIVLTEPDGRKRYFDERL